MRRRHTASSVAWRVEWLCPLLALGWLGLIAVQTIRDQIALEPPRPPTRAESAVARPRALADWRIVYARLVGRLPQQPLPLELGAVWATRSGQICGLVNKWDSGVDDMTPFYTIGLQPVFRRENERRYVDVWLQCRFDQWVELHPGSYQTGFCATRFGRPRCLDWKSNG